MKEDRAIHRTVRLPKQDDDRLMTICGLTGLTISEQLREFVRQAKVVTVVHVEHPLNSDAGSLVLADPAGISR